MDQQLTSFAFFLCTFLEYFSFNIIISGSQDILAGTHVPTSLVLFASVAPMCVVVLIANYFVQRIPYGVRVAFSVIVGIVGFIQIAYVETVKWKLVGVGCVSLGMGVTDISFLGLMSYFESNAVSAYSAGSGMGLLTSPLFYLAMTTWMCVSPKTTIIIVAPLQLLYLLSYYIISKRVDLGRRQRVDHEDAATYTKLESSDTEDSEDGQSKERKQSKAIVSANDGLTLKEKCRVFIKMSYAVLLPMYITFVNEYLIIQSVITTIAYKNAPFRPRDHYQYYIFLVMIGELIGRSHRFVLSHLRPSWLYGSTPAILWVFTVLETLHLVFFIFESWYRFLPNVTTALVLCFTTGIAIGVVYNNEIEVVHGSFEGQAREFVLSFATAPLNLGILTASLIGLYVEPRLLEHCVSKVRDTAYCFTRSTSVKDITARCGMTT